MKYYYYAIKDQQFGPISLDELKKKDFLTRETKIWHEGLYEWKYAKDIEELKEYFRSVPPPLSPGPQENYSTPPLLNPEPLKDYSTSSPFNNIHPISLTKKTINKPLFLTVILSCSLIGILIYFISIVAGSTPLLIVGISLLITANVFIMIFIYKKWNFIKKHSLTIPGQIVGFLFIPFFNFYWIFVVFIRFTKIYNKVLQSNRKHDSLLIPIGLSVALSVFMLCSGLFPLTGFLVILLSGYEWIFVLFGLIIFIVFIVLLSIYIYKVSDSINEISELE
ncbi:DUF4339 domain-containing protein [Bacteroidota bacterium]